jgi:hypothetical protein
LQRCWWEAWCRVPAQASPDHSSPGRQRRRAGRSGRPADRSRHHNGRRASSALHRPGGDRHHRPRRPPSGQRHRRRPRRPVPRPRLRGRIVHSERAALQLQHRVVGRGGVAGEEALHRHVRPGGAHHRLGPVGRWHPAVRDRRRLSGHPRRYRPRVPGRPHHQWLARPARHPDHRPAGRHGHLPALGRAHHPMVLRHAGSPDACQRHRGQPGGHREPVHPGGDGGREQLRTGRDGPLADRHRRRPFQPEQAGEADRRTSRPTLPTAAICRPGNASSNRSATRRPDDARPTIRWVRTPGWWPARRRPPTYCRPTTRRP